MQTTNGPLRPRDRKIDARMRILGVLGFLLLAVAFFSIGVFCIGPRLGSSRQTVKPSETVPAYIPPHSSRPLANEDQPKDKGPDIKLEVTEEGANVPAADEPAQGSDDVRVDENGLTITLDGRGRHPGEQAGDGNMPRAVEPRNSTSTPVTPDKPASTRTKDTGRSGSNLEKPRAATEKHTTDAPARD